MSIIEIVPEVFTADFVGEPGNRTFYLQARGDGVLTMLVEKEQVAALGDRMRELLVLVDPADTVQRAPAARDPALAVTEPLEPVWRIGTMGLAYLDDRDAVVVAVEPAENDSETAGEDEYRFVIRRDQARAFVLHVLAVVAEGRPICRLCGLPMDPSGHQCPASNGHHVEA